VVRGVIDTAIGMAALMGLAFRTRFAFGGPYWAWRRHTAFGRGMPEGALARLAALVHLARWMGRMRRTP